MELQMDFLILLCVLVCDVLAVQEKSEDITQKINVPSRWLEDLKANLPETYYCCKDGQTLDLNKWNLDNGTVLTNSICIDGGGIRSNFSLKCEYVSVLDASLKQIVKNEYKHIELYIEDETVYAGDHSWIKFKGTANNVCFGNYTSPETNEVRLMLMMCENTEFNYAAGFSPLYGRLALASLPFLLLTIAIYALLPELRDLQGLSILSLCSTYVISLIMMANLILNRSYRASNGLCRVGGLITYYSTIASFFWMNAITAQVFVSIRHPKLPMSWKKQFKWYSVYAWGLTGLLTFVVMVADIIPGSHVLPELGMNYFCWFRGRTAKWIYYLGPMTLVLTSNTLLFLASVVLLFRQTSSSDHKKLRYKLLLSLRLFVVVGITWLCEPLQFAFGNDNFVWFVLDVWNCLQGLFIFVFLVVLRKRAMLGLTSRGYMFCLTSYIQAWIKSLNDEEELVYEHGSM